MSTVVSQFSKLLVAPSSFMIVLVEADSYGTVKTFLLTRL